MVLFGTFLMGKHITISQHATVLDDTTTDKFFHVYLGQKLNSNYTLGQKKVKKKVGSYLPCFYKYVKGR